MFSSEAIKLAVDLSHLDRDVLERVGDAKFSIMFPSRWSERLEAPCQGGPQPLRSNLDVGLCHG